MCNRLVNLINKAKWLRLAPDIRKVLLCIAHYNNDNTNSCIVSYQVIAEKCGLKRRNLILGFCAWTAYGI